MNSHSVGQLFPDPVPSQEGGMYTWDRSGQTFVISRRAPSSQEIESVKTGPVHLGLLVEEYALVWLVQIGRLPWQYAFYHYQMATPEDRPDLVMLPSDEDPYTLNVVLVDQSSGIVRARREISMPLNFSRALLEAVSLQAVDSSFNPDLYETTVDGVVRGYVSVEEMLEECGARAWLSNGRT